MLLLGFVLMFVLMLILAFSFKEGRLVMLACPSLACSEFLLLSHTLQLRAHLRLPSPQKYSLLLSEKLDIL